MTLQESVLKLEHHARARQYRGYDPYDALQSPLFKLPGLNSGTWIRQTFQTFLKRFPLNIRPLLLVPKGINPVTLGLFIQGYAYLSVVFPEFREDFHLIIRELADHLESLIPRRYSGACWGYDFDLETSYASIPAYQPTIFATGVITNGLYEAWKITRFRTLKELVISSSDFVSRDLNRTGEGEGFCFSTSPFDKEQNFRACMKAVRLLSQVYSITGATRLKQEADLAARFVVSHQHPDGSRVDSPKEQGRKALNHHTGSILDCLDEYIRHCNAPSFDEHLYLGYEEYKNQFILENGRPKLYSESIYPADCTAAAQSILTLTRFGDLDMAGKTARWTLDHMQSDDGGFYFRKFKHYTIKTPYMRWSNAWMFASMGYLLMKESLRDEKRPLVPG